MSLNAPVPGAAIPAWRALGERVERDRLEINENGIDDLLAKDLEH